MQPQRHGEGAFDLAASRLRPGISAIVLAAVAALALGGFGEARAETAERSPATAAAATAALEQAEQALAPATGDPDRSATGALADLAAALPALSGIERRRAEALLARPTDGAADPFFDGYDVPPEDIRRTQSPEGGFCVIWVTSGPDRPPGAGNDGVPDYVAEVAAIAEQAREVQAGELGWRPPVPDLRDECGVEGQTDIYLKNVGAFGIFGYQAVDLGQGQARRKHGYLVIDNDFRPAQFPGFAEPLDAARVTIAHELNHLLQIAYSSHQDDWMFESTATWMEHKVFPAIDDWLRYVPRFARNPGVPITAEFGGGGLKIYGAAVWNHWLESRFGAGSIRDAWEASPFTRPSDFAVRSYGRAIASAGAGSFSTEFVRFAAATAEWRAGPLPRAGRLPDVRRQGRLAPADQRAFRLHHTGYRLLNVARPDARRIRLQVRAPRTLRFGVALVARRGGPRAGQVVRRVRFVRGGEQSVVLRAPQRFNRVTAVVVNADARIRGRRFGDWLYTRDSEPFRVRLMVNR